MARSACWVLSKRVARSRIVVLSLGVARSRNMVLSLGVTRSYRLVLSCFRDSLSKRGSLMQGWLAPLL